MAKNGMDKNDKGWSTQSPEECMTSWCNVENGSRDYSGEWHLFTLHLILKKLKPRITCWWTGISRPSTFWPFCSITLIMTKNMLIASSSSGEVTTAYNSRQNVNTYKNKCSVFYAEKLVPCSWRDRLQYFWELFSSALEVIRAFWAGPRP